MIINLKQTEIEQALRAYVASQGISLHGKDLTISFTAGRRESGISAEISIDDVEIPGYTNDTPLEGQPFKAAVLSIAPPVVTDPPVPEDPVGAEPGEVPVAPEELKEPEVQPEVEAAPAKATVSLFG